MDEKPDKPIIPLELKAIACLYILYGFAQFVRCVMQFVDAEHSLESMSDLEPVLDMVCIGLSGLFITYMSWGLLKLRPMSRNFILFLVWMWFIMSALMLLFCLVDLVLSQNRMPKLGFCVLPVFIFLVAFWQYRVLTKPAIRELFGNRGFFDIHVPR